MRKFLKKDICSEKEILNNSEIQRNKLREEHAKWLSSYGVDYLATLTFRNSERTLLSAKRYVCGLFDKLRREFFGRHCVKYFFRNSKLKNEIAGAAFFEEHVEGGYHVHLLIYLPRNPNRNVDFENLFKSVWTKMTKAFVLELKRCESKEDSKSYALYSAKNFGRRFDHSDRIEYYCWNKPS